MAAASRLSRSQTSASSSSSRVQGCAVLVAAGPPRVMRASAAAPRTTRWSSATAVQHSSVRHSRIVACPAAREQLGQVGLLDGSTAVVIVDHGSRKRSSNEMLVEFGQLYKQLTSAHTVEIAHMEIAEPTIEQAVARCSAAGARRVVVAPYFLSRGRHIQEDIPLLVRQAREKHPHLEIAIAEPIGIDPLMAQLIHNRVNAALSDQPAAAADKAGVSAAAAAAVATSS